MRVDSAKVQNHLQKYRKSEKPAADRLAPGQNSPKDKIQINSKKNDTLIVAKNTPSDPTVSTKVLDSLNLGMINFNQKERDTLATIMGDKANAVKENRQNNKVEVQAKKIEHLKVAKNSPDDPTVSTKVLDSLNLGMINFNQKEKDVLATIMSDKAQKVRERIAKA
jgi:hypothetical protein